MLKKCLKHEWKASWKHMALLNGAAVFMGILGGFGILFSMHRNLPDLLVVLYIVAYILVLLGSAVMTTILMIQRYYKNLFTDQGYLTNVLPVSATDQILSKLLVFAIWSILNGICLLLSVGFLFLPAAIEYFTTTSVSFADFWNFGWTQLSCILKEAFDLLGLTNLAGRILYTILGFLASTGFHILLIYASISIGSLISGHKILAAVLTYLAATTLIQIFSGLGVVTVFQSSTPHAMITVSSLFFLLLTVVLDIVLFLICRYILSRRLNLA